jgi:hypothetical protein
MYKFEFGPVISEDEVSEIERISQENSRQISANWRIALTILAYDKERLYESVTRDPMTYYHLIKSMEGCMEALKAQLKILESAETRLMAPLGVNMDVNGKVH